MKITHVETIHLRFEYAHGFTYAGGTCTGRLASLIRVHTDEGAVGIGSVYSHPALVEIVVKQQLEPWLIGEDPTESWRLWEMMYGLTRWYGRKGAAMSALGAVDTALWDLKAQQADQPLWKLLGGSKGECPAYASALLWKSPEELAQEAQQLIAQGFRRVKMRLGHLDERDLQAVRAVREAIGDEHDIMVDGSMRYTLESARELAEFLEEQQVFWFEEPFPPEEIALAGVLRQLVDIPLAAGENEFGLQGFCELVDAVDILQPDASRCGGITEMLRVAALAKEHELRIAPHSWCDAVAIVANAHVVATIPHGVTVEVDKTGNPFVEELLTKPLSITNGLLRLSDAPGLGIELNEDTIERHRIPDVFNIPNGVYSDMIFGRM
ncbi:MAG: mandelate racemase/muconate lactonizing enzyme family protein [Planctomycetaceae bacterium]|nr:mandelate racemase/muconate lactonizing enzyme family protein [Planctomycetaceae bacterium]